MPGAVGASLPGASEDEEEDGGNEVDRLVAFVCEHAEIWHSPLREAFATVNVDDNRETYAITSDGFRDWFVAAWRRKWRPAGRSDSPPRARQRDGAPQSQIAPGTQPATRPRAASPQGSSSPSATTPVTSGCHLYAWVHSSSTPGFTRRLFIPRQRLPLGRPMESRSPTPAKLAGTYSP